MMTALELCKKREWKDARRLEMARARRRHGPISWRSKHTRPAEERVTVLPVPKEGVKKEVVRQRGVVAEAARSIMRLFKPRGR